MVLRLRKLESLVLAVIIAGLFVFTIEISAYDGDKAPLKTAIFVRNNGGKALANEVNTFNDMLSARLTDKGFGVMDWKDVVQKFSDSNESDEQIFSNVKNLMSVDRSDVSDNSNSPVNSSILRIAQMLGADYIVVASMGSFGHEKRTFKGEGTIYKTNNSADIYTIPLTARVLAGNSGQSVYGDTITASTRIYQNAAIDIKTDNIVNKIIDSGTVKLAGNIGSKIDLIRDNAVKHALPVKFTVECNIDGATVELDGAAIGSPPGSFQAVPGLHQLRITREYFQPWERTVNIYPNQKLTVSLELSNTGLAKYKNITAFNQDQKLQNLERTASVDIAKEQSKADADAKEKVSSGREVFQKNSYIRSDGFASQLGEIIHGN